MSESITLSSEEDFDTIITLINHVKNPSDLLKIYNEENIGDAVAGLKASYKQLSTEINAVIVTLSNYQKNDKEVVFVEEKLTENLNTAKENMKDILKESEQLKGQNDTEDNEQRPEQMKISKTITEKTNLLEESIETIRRICRKRRNIEDNKNEDYYYLTKEKPPCVVMFANYEFTRKDNNLPGIEKDITKAKELFANKEIFPNIKTYYYKNLTKDQTLKEIENLKDKSFDNYSSLIIIFNSHGGRDGTLNTSDEKDINIVDFYKACEKHLNFKNKPIILIFETCRGRRVDRASSIRPLTKATFHRFHPERNNYLIVYATSDGNVALFVDNDGTTVVSGSRFLQIFFEIIEEHPNWDILAQLTKTTDKILQKCKPHLTNKKEHQNYPPNTPFNQTVTFISLFPRQFRFSDESIHKWDDINPYQFENVEKVHVLFNEADERPYTKNKQCIKNAIEKAGFIEICIETDRATWWFLLKKIFLWVFKAFQHIKRDSDVHTTIIITFGIVSDWEMHKTILPKLQGEYSFINKRELSGRPKVFLNLGPSDSTTKGRDEVAIKGYDDDTESTKITENSDCLSYCDEAEGWCKAICEVIEKSGDSVGLVRLLTEAMRRPEALGSKHPPHIQSSLRHKLVLP